MPNLITHRYISDLIKNQLSGKTAEVVFKEPDAYNLGAIGPDFTFALRELNVAEGKRLPNVMQYLNMYEVFEGVGRHLQEKPDEVKLSYTLGLLCHYVADFNVHPYVNYFVEEGRFGSLPTQHRSAIHTIIESGIDSHLIEEQFGMKSNKYPAGITCKGGRRVKKAIAALYSDVVNGIFGIKIRNRKLILAFSVTGFFMKLSIDRTGLKRKIFGRLEDFAGGKKKVTSLIRPAEGYGKIDYMNRSHKAWRKVRNGEEVSYESLDEVIERIKVQAAEYIDKFMQFVNNGTPLKREDFAVNYEGVKIY